MKNIVLATFLILLCFSSIAKEKEVVPKGGFEKIEVSEQNLVAKELLKGNNSFVAKALKAPEKYSPPVLYALSHVLFKEGRKDDAMFWFYAGQLRAIEGKKRCK